MDIVHTRALFAPLQADLLELLRGFRPEDWARPTAAGQWTVRQVAAHLLDTMLRRVSSLDSDFHAPAPATPISDYASLVNHVNTLNASWVAAMDRLSPAVLVGLLEWVGPQFQVWLWAQDLSAQTSTGVAWAGEVASSVWFDVAREFSEQWHHQQQIRDAVGKPLLTAYLHPVPETFMRGLPYGYRALAAETGSSLNVEISGSAGGHWHLRRHQTHWSLESGSSPAPSASLECDQDIAWRLFTKGFSGDAAAWVRFSGERRFLLAFLEFVAVIG